MAPDENRMSARVTSPRSAVLLAAGLGARLKSTADVPKPLVRVADRTLAEWSMTALQAGAGINHFVVSVGYAADVLKAHFRKIARRIGVAVDFVSADDWERGNGASTLAAEAKLTSAPFLLSMTDHLFDPRIAGALAGYPLVAGEMCLAVDRDKDGIFDLDDVTRVRSDGDCILAIEKNLDRWDCGDTGVMLCDFSIFDGLRRAATLGQHGLSDGLRQLARERKARVVDVTGFSWLDVDTPEAHREAERRYANRSPAEFAHMPVQSAAMGGGRDPMRAAGDRPAGAVAQPQATAAGASAKARR